MFLNYFFLIKYTLPLTKSLINFHKLITELISLFLTTKIKLTELICIFSEYKLISELKTFIYIKKYNFITTELISLILKPIKHTELKYLFFPSSFNFASFNSTHIRTFNGDFIYAQNKRQHVVMAKRLAERYPSIYFATWHLGRIL